MCKLIYKSTDQIDILPALAVGMTALSRVMRSKLSMVGRRTPREGVRQPAPGWPGGRARMEPNAINVLYGATWGETRHRRRTVSVGSGRRRC